jgi:hypothetical protein
MARVHRDRDLSFVESSIDFGFWQGQSISQMASGTAFVILAVKEAPAKTWQA